ncbi:MAG: endonuclease/exonuclease/phosphatase family protein [Clostridia bacterium]|nr:endonuclease/exonuclease/phosphatase family protein [Clostridia bacterium]
MKKLMFITTIILTLAIFTSCQQQEPVTLEPPFPTAESVNAMIESLGEVNDVESAAMVSKTLENYQALDSVSQTKVTDIQRVFDLSKTAAEFFPVEDSTLKVMSFNIRYNEFTEDRIDRVISLILQESPDIIGLQESTVEWVAVLNERLSDKYGILGHGREKKLDGESNNALYKKDKFDLLESDTLWLTDTPDVCSRHPESACYRILTYQFLERKTDGKRFLHVNTHLDHVSEAARVSQAQILTSWIKDNFNSSVPTVLTGDFNCGSETKEYQTIIDADYSVTNIYGESVRTYQGYSETGGAVIDFIFVNEMFPAISYKVCPEKMDGQWISDHNAIVSELLLLPAYDSIEIPTEE